MRVTGRAHTSKLGHTAGLAVTMLSIALLVVLVVNPAVAGSSGGSMRLSDSAPPEVPVATFAAPTEWRTRPHEIGMGSSACAPYFSKLHWNFYGTQRARAQGMGVFPHLSKTATDCSTALAQAIPKPTRIVLSKPRSCPDILAFTRIAWGAHGEHGHYVARCEE